jgi:peptidoglycan/xylan/chitin deacetylase (PgdA/CDA1 family)
VLAAAVLLSGSPNMQGASASVTRQVFAPVLIYHHVKPLLPSDDAIERGLTVLPSQFEAQIRYLRTTGYRVITAAQLARHLRTGSALPAKPVVLSFDDGYADTFGQVYGRLLRAHVKGTFFIVPSFLGTPRYLSWRQVEIMAAQGMDIEAHTMTHPDLTRIGPRSVRWQLTESRRELRARLHRAVNVMAYPYGAYSQQVVAAVARAGYQAAFTTQQGWVESSAHPLIEPRVYVDIDDTLAIFAGRVRGDPRILAADPT